MATDDYEAGRRDAEILALKSNDNSQSERMDSFERSLRILERIVYGLCGAIGLIQALPMMRDML